MLSNYPLGAENDPRAPYNQVDSKAIDKEVCVSITLSKTLTIPIDDYIANEYDEFDMSDGDVVHLKGVDYDFSNSNLNEAYSKHSYSIPELLKELSIYLIKDIQDDSVNKYTKSRLKKMLKACGDWTVDEEEVTLDE